MPWTSPDPSHWPAPDGAKWTAALPDWPGPDVLAWEAFGNVSANMPSRTQRDGATDGGAGGEAEAR